MKFLRNMFRHVIYVTVFTTLLTFVGCSEVSEPIAPSGPKPPVEETWEISPKGHRALNVVFFKPSDVTVTSKELKEISDLMNYVQAWYLKHMKENGYDKTFGLLKNNYGTVKVHIVEAPGKSAEYDDKYDGTKRLVHAYFRENPDLELSKHTFILGDKNTGVGMVGQGRWAQASSDDYSLKYAGKTYKGFSLRVDSDNRMGGVMHELGHGLNLPHNSHKASQNPYVALMGHGNTTYNKRPQEIFLTKSSAAILNANSLFNPVDNGIDYYKTKPVLTLRALLVRKNKIEKKIIIETEFLSSIPVTNSYVGFDFVNEGAVPPNDNYDEITFTVIPEKMEGDKYKVIFEVPYNELFSGFQSINKDEVDISINVITENGIRRVLKNFFCTIDVNTKVPNDDILRDIDERNPVAKFYYTNDIDDARIVTFTNTSSYQGNYSWDFGDGNSSTEKNPVHTYSAEDEYTVKLSITNTSNSETVSIDKIVITKTYPNIALGVTTVHSSEHNDIYVSSKLVDGDKRSIGSRWITTKHTKRDEWVEFDFKKTVRVVRVSITSVADSTPKEFQIQYWDGSMWQTSRRVLENTLANISVALDPIDTTKIRLYITKSVSSDKWVKIYEVEIFGQD